MNEGKIIELTPYGDEVPIYEAGMKVLSNGISLDGSTYECSQWDFTFHNYQSYQDRNILFWTTHFSRNQFIKSNKNLKTLKWNENDAQYELNGECIFQDGRIYVFDCGVYITSASSNDYEIGEYYRNWSGFFEFKGIQFLNNNWPKY